MLAQHLHLLACPVCHAALVLGEDWIDCSGCRRRYPIVDSLPVLIASRATLPAG
jgi:uncharacterized protein YbaR (Trm112 family)